MPKRKSTHPDNADAPRRSARRRTAVKRNDDDSDAPPSPPRPAARSSTSTAGAARRGGAAGRRGGRQAGEGEETPAPGEAQGREGDDGSSGGSGGGRRQYWLMKAEPETRYEKGRDISFSIDDLKGRTEPEPWDGIRNYSARNNLRAMKKGDLAFFSHSNCKEPGIVGTMEIVQEHSPDLSAHDPENPYYDPKSTPSDPKWSVVHVEFRSKFPAPIPLKEMRKHAGPGGPLEHMQMLTQTRLSVSRVRAEEWDFLMGLAEKMGKGESAE